MKGGLTSIIMAAEAIRQSGIRLKGDLVVACVAGETQGGEGTYYLMQSGLRTDMAVVAEPFGADNLVTVHAGIVHMAIHTYGITGHIGRLEGTVNAVQKMTKVIDALQHVEFRYTPRPDLPAFPRLNVGSIIGGRGTDYILVEPPYIPDLCTIMVDVHFLPGMTVDGILADIRRVLDPLTAEDPELRYAIEVPPPNGFKGRRRLIMEALDVPVDSDIV
jgi:acetylornithine deacetylase